LGTGSCNEFHIDARSGCRECKISLQPRSPLTARAVKTFDDLNPQAGEQRNLPHVHAPPEIDREIAGGGAEV
jgi:hypothetical protein